MKAPASWMKRSCQRTEREARRHEGHREKSLTLSRTESCHYLNTYNTAPPNMLHPPPGVVAQVGRKVGKDSREGKETAALGFSISGLNLDSD